MNIPAIGIYIGRGGGSSGPNGALLAKLLFWGKYSEIAGGHMPNKITGATDYLTVSGSAGSETYQCPNTAPYIAADTDYIWFKTDTTQRTTTTAELIGYDLQRTPVKYDDNAPNALREIIIFKVGETLTASERDSLFQYMWLPILWDNNLNAYGHIKSNRTGQQLWPSEATYDADMATYISGLTTPLSNEQKTLLNTFFVDIKSGLGISALSEVFDAMYIFANETSESSLRNLVERDNDATLHGATPPSHTPLQGFLGDGATGYINTNFNPHTESTMFSQDNASFGIYSRTSRAVSTTKIHGVTISGQFITILPLRAAANTRVSLNTSGNNTITTATSLGMISAFRDAAANAFGAKNKTLSSAEADASTTIPNGDVYLLGQNLNGSPSGFDDIEISFAYLGRCLSQAELNTVFDRFEAYMDANGKGVV